MSTTNAGALGIVVDADTASFDSSMSKVGAIAEREMKRAEKAAATAKTENDKFVASIQRQIDTFGKTGTEMLAYEARLRGISGQAQPLIDRLNRMKDAQDAFNQKAASSSGIGALTAGLNEATTAAGHAATGTSGITRELIVLAHEASQGQFKRFGGSLLVLAEYSTTAQAAIRALAGPVGVVAGAVALLALAAYEGAHAADVMSKSLILTGNFAGTTAGQVDVLAKALSATTGSGIGKAQAALQALISTGEVGPRVLGDMAAATVKLEALTGKTADEIAKDFTRMAEAPTKWAVETNKAYNFLSLAQYDHIKRLEEEGKTEEATIAVLARLNEHLGTKLPQSLTGLGVFLHNAGLAWDGFWHSALHNGGPEAVEDRISKLRAELAAVNDHHQSQSGTYLNPQLLGEERARIQAELHSALMDQLRQKEQALGQAEQERANKEQIAAKSRLDIIHDQLKGQDLLKKDLTEYASLVEKLKDTPDAISPSQQKTDIAAIRHRDRSPLEREGESEAKRLAASIKERLQLYDVERAKLEEEATQYQLYGKVLDKTAEAMARVETASGKFAKASAADKAAIIAAARDVDNAATIEKKAKADAEAAKQRATWSQELTKRLTDEGIATDLQIEKLSEETHWLGLNTLQRQIATEALRIEKQRRVELADVKNVGNEDAINASALKRTNDITAAMTRADAETKSFGYGSARAFKIYADEAANAAKFAESAVGGSLSRLEDALVQFSHTGRLSFSSLFQFMADEFIRQQIRMQIASASKGVAGVLGNLFGSFFAGNSGAATATANALPGDSLDNLITITDGYGTIPSHAAGLSYVPYDGYLARLHEGERVQTKSEASGSASNAPSVHYSPVFNLNGPVPQETIIQIRGEVARSQQAFARQLRASGATV